MKRPKISFGFCSLVCLMAWLDLGFCLRFLCCALWHEGGHLAVMKLCGVPVSGFSLSAAGAVIETAFYDEKKEFLCAAAGPLAGAVLGCFLLRVEPKTAMISMLLSLVNLLPVYPLDGGRMLRALLLRRFSAVRTERLLHMVSVCVCCVLMLLACWGTVCLQMGLWPIFAALVLLWRAGSRE